MQDIKQISQGIVELLKNKGLIEYLPELISELQKESELNKFEVVIESAVELSDVDLDNLVSTISKNLGFEPQIIEQVNPDLLAGVKVRIGDKVIDISLKNKLEQLKNIIN